MIASTSVFIFLYIFWWFVYSLRCMAYVHLHGLLQSGCSSVYIVSSGDIIMYWILYVHVHIHRSNHPMPTCGTLTAVAFDLLGLCYIVLGNLFCSMIWVGAESWYSMNPLKPAIYFSGCLLLWRTGFNDSSSSVLCIKGQSFYSWKIRETLNFFTNTFLNGL